MRIETLLLKLFIELYHYSEFNELYNIIINLTISENASNSRVVCKLFYRATSQHLL